jgi:hypothetical protein
MADLAELVLEAPVVEAPVTEAPAREALVTREDLRLLLSLTRAWIQYGTLGFAVFCIVVGAVENLLAGS